MSASRTLALLVLMLVPTLAPGQTVSADTSAVSWSVVQTSEAFMRKSPSYTSPMESQVSMGTLVQVLEQTGYWVKIRTPEPYEGWVNELCLAPTDSPREYLSNARVICTAEYSHIWQEPQEDSQRLSDFIMGNIVACTGRADVLGKWIEVRRPSGQRGWVRSADVENFSVWAGSPHTADEIVALARRFLGVPYLWGGRSVKHFDCSGLVGFCYFMNGYLLPRDSVEQIKLGVEVPPEEMREGDLVFFGEERVSHVALCTGPGRIIHSSQLVRENSLDKDATDAYTRHIICVRRVMGTSDLVKISSHPAYFN